ncbi:BTAD domain-containing putative transcriptional regulator [Sphaerisporangium flaviroseum]|uniref:BTAD domain-containing putative transcriptional regulator n=1 Tax=Sphaerisporangium flaviroseum TaxID=509199 RepID=A0ABP7IDS3_9ACTN
MLGTLQVTHDGRTVSVGTALKPRLMLAALLSRAGRQVSNDSLTTVLWGDHPPPSARRNIQLYAHKLRRELGADRISGMPDGYVINVGDELDATRFRRLAAEGTVALGRGDVEEAGDLLGAALGLWAGPAFAGLRESETIAEEALRLEDLRLDTHERYLEAELARGRHAELVGELIDLTREHPYREGLRAGLMLALYRSGRQTDALGVFRETRALLAEELGIEPGPPLRRLHEAILRADEDLMVPATGGIAVSPAPEPRPVPRELPPDIVGFTGRHRQLETLDGRLSQDPTTGPAPVVIIIAGTAGVGKTALAVHWAHRVARRFPDGQLYLNLQGHATDSPRRPIDALAVLLRSLGARPDQVPMDMEEAASRYRSLVADRRMLLVLDNARSADQVRPLLPAGTGCTVLVTSRDRLTGLVARDGAHRVTLDALTPHESIELLGTLLGADRIEEEAAAAARLAELCAHLPLALRIAGAHLVDRPRGTIADHVAELAALDAGDLMSAMAIEDDEETAVRAAFDLSYRTMTAPVQRLFRRLGLVSCADFTGPAAAALAGMTVEEAAAALDRLSAAHLVDQRRPGRFTLHDLLRSYAVNLAETEDDGQERQAAMRRLFTWYVGMVDTAVRYLYPEATRLPPPEEVSPAGAEAFDPATVLGWLDAERHNLLTFVRHAARQGASPTAWLLTDGLRDYYDRRRHRNDWITIALAGLSAARVADDLRAQATVFHCLARVNFGLFRHPRAIAYLTRAIELSVDAGWGPGEASALGNLGVILYLLGRPAEAATHLSRARELHHRFGWRQGEARILNTLASAYGECGRVAEGAELATEALALNRDAGALRAEVGTMCVLGGLRHRLGHLDGALAQLTGALALARRLGSPYDEATSLAGLALVHRDAGRLHSAYDCAEAALEIAVDTGERRLEAHARTTLASVCGRAGDHEGAIALLETALTIAGEIDVRILLGEALLGLAEARFLHGEHAAATDHAEEALKLAEQAEFRVLEGQVLTLLARIGRGREPAARMIGYAREALAVHGETGNRLDSARTHLALGQALRDEGDMGLAETHLRQASALFSAIGAPFSEAEPAG